MTQDHASRLKGLVWVVLACLVGVLFAAGLAPLAHAIPWSWETKLGKALDTGLTKRECRYRAQPDALLQRVVQRLYPIESGDHAFSIQVRVVTDPAINAYAALGGKITVNSGLLSKAESPEELAGVLAHEIEHVHHRHIMEGTLVHLFTAEGFQLMFGQHSSAADWVQYFLNMDFTRTQEVQADEDGLRRLQQAHVDNRGFRQFFERMEKTDSTATFLSDHPSNRERLEMARRFDNRDVSPIMTATEWQLLKNYCSRQ